LSLSAKICYCGATLVLRSISPIMKSLEVESATLAHYKIGKIAAEHTA
jgi:hypothetical protein